MTKAEAFKVLTHIYCIKAETVAECEAVGMAMDALEQPERKQGKWVRDEFGSKCLCCGSYAYRDKFGEPWESDFCPGCGADLRGGKTMTESKLKRKYISASELYSRVLERRMEAAKEFFKLDDLASKPDFSLNQQRWRAYWKGRKETLESVMEYIRDAAAADVEEVIRCRNCRYWLEGHYCMYDDQVHTHSDFCSWAERIEKPDENAGN